MKRQELYHQVLERSLPIKQSKFDLQIAEGGHHAVLTGLIVPKPVLSSGYALSQQGTTTTSKTYTLGMSFGGTTGFGLMYSLDLPKYSKVLSTYLDPLSATNVDSEANSLFFGLSLQLPLLKGSWFFVGNRARVDADVALDSAKLAQKSALLSALSSAEQAFYDVLLKQIRLQVLQSSVESSKALLGDVQEMVNVGETDRFSLVKVELQIAQAETDLLQGRNDLEAAIQNLKELIAFQGEGQVFPDPTEVKIAPQIPSIGLEEAVRRAKQNRSDWRLAQFQKQRVELDIEKSTGDLFPKLDVEAGYGFLSSKPTFDEAFAEVQKFSAPVYSVGLKLTYNFYDPAERFAYTQARINRQKAELSLQQLDNQIRKELTTVIQSLPLASNRLKMSTLAKDLSEKKLLAEFEKFRVGESNIRNVTDSQKEVDSARIVELNARIDLHRLTTALRISLGEFPEGLEPQL